MKKQQRKDALTMMELEIPGQKAIKVRHLVLDYNGTLACDGTLLDGVGEKLTALAESFTIHVITADTFGGAAAALADLPCVVTVIPKEQQADAKWLYVRDLGFDETVCVGNGRNDALMLRDAALSIAVVQGEGCALEALMASQITAPSILDGLDLLINPLRLRATLRI